MNELKQLDTVLRIITDSSENITKTIRSDGLIETTSFIIKPQGIKDDAFLADVLLKLQRDGYIEEHKNNLGIVPGEKDYYYKTTFEGRIFNLRGGYLAQIKSLNSQIKNQKIKDILLICGSWIAGIGTLVLAAVEIWKLCVS